jgi:hypothetical protein
MAQIKAGSRVKSTVCNAELMVIAAPAGDVEIQCGGAAMIELGGESPAGVALDPNFKGGVALGKRYVSESADLELLCTKPGEGSLSVGGVALTLKEAKPLPSSD